jgi:hypothetical protein
MLPDSLTASGTANQANVEPLVKEVIAALDAAKSELDAIDPTALRKRQSDDEVASLVAEIVTVRQHPTFNFWKRLIHLS